MDTRWCSRLTKAEFDCKQTGENEMQPHFMSKLRELRELYGKPMNITSGYRSPRHSIEAAKARPGFHAQGLAVDIGIGADGAPELVWLALSMGFSVGVSQKNGRPRFIHLDLRPGTQVVFSY